MIITLELQWEVIKHFTAKKESTKRKKQVSRYHEEFSNSLANGYMVNYSIFSAISLVTVSVLFTA